MNPELRELLSRYLDGDLGPQERAMVERELRRPEVARELERLERLRRAVRHLASREAPPARLDLLMRSVRMQPTHRPVWRTPAALAAVTVLAAALLVAVLPHGGKLRDGVAEVGDRFAAAPAGRPSALARAPIAEGEARSEGETPAESSAEARRAGRPPRPHTGSAAKVRAENALLRLAGAELPLAVPMAEPETSEVTVRIRGGRVVEVLGAPEGLKEALDGLRTPGVPDGVHRGRVEPVRPGR